MHLALRWFAAMRNVLLPAAPGIGLRPTSLFWILLAIGGPLILAWIAADRASSWAMNWWRTGGSGIEFGVHLWAVRLVSSAIVYSLASALGLLATFLFDRCCYGKQ
jgi:hypothetical protein